MLFRLLVKLFIYSTSLGCVRQGVDSLDDIGQQYLAINNIDYPIYIKVSNRIIL